jgi:hypothetical protein
LLTEFVETPPEPSDTAAREIAVSVIMTAVTMVAALIGSAPPGAAAVEFMLVGVARGHSIPS